MVSGNGTELTSNAILNGADQTGVGWQYIAPGKPQQNGGIESFNGRLRWSVVERDDWMTPGAYPSVLYGEAGGTLRFTGAPPRPLATTKQKAQINPGLS